MNLELLGDRIRQVRLERGLTLQQLAGRSAVSISMLSSVERGGKAATIVVLDRIATGLGAALTDLLVGQADGRVILRRSTEQDVVEEPGGWQRTILTPVVAGVNFEWIHSRLPAGCDAGTFDGYAPGSHEFVAVDRGTLTMTIGYEPYELAAGNRCTSPPTCRTASQPLLDRSAATTWPPAMRTATPDAPASTGPGRRRAGPAVHRPIAEGTIARMAASTATPTRFACELHGHDHAARFRMRLRQVNRRLGWSTYTAESPATSSSDVDVTASDRSSTPTPGTRPAATVQTADDSARCGTYRTALFHDGGRRRALPEPAATNGSTTIGPSRARAISSCHRRLG